MLDQHFGYFHQLAYERIFQYMKEDMYMRVCTFADVSMYLLQAENVKICKKIHVFW